LIIFVQATRGSVMDRNKRSIFFSVLSLFVVLLIARNAIADDRPTYSPSRHENDEGKPAPLSPRAHPYALAAGSGIVNVQFSVRMMGKKNQATTVYLRRTGVQESIAMNDLGKDGDVTAKDGIQRVSVQIDTDKEKPDTCVQYETFIKHGKAELKSAPVQLCVSSFPVNLAESNVARPAVFPDGSKAVADEILLTVTPSTTAAAIRELASSIHANIVGSYMTLNLYQLKLPTRLNVNQLLELAAQLKARPGVVSTSINAIGSYAYVPDDTAFNLPPSDINSQHGLKLVLAHNQTTGVNAWDSNTKGAGRTVVVMDTGLDLTHPDLGPTDPGDPAWTCQSGTCSDTDGHGTQVTGVIAAKTHNTQGVAGVAFKSKIHSIQVSTSSSSITATQMITAFTAARDYVAAHPEATVINASFYAAGGSGTAAQWSAVCGLVEQVVFDGLNARAVVINAVGNVNMNAVTYPAACKNSMAHPELLIAVSASISIDYSSTVPLTSDPLCLPLDNPGSSLNQRCRSSSYGAWVDVAAPGSMIRTTSIGNTYPSSTGNSFSAPLVAGAAAILNSCGVSPDLIKSTLTSSATVSVPYPAYGAYPAGTTPLLDISRALQYVNHAPTAVNLSNSSLNDNTDTTTGVEVGTLTATDSDSCDKHSYSIVSSADSAKFSIGGSDADRLILTNGVLTYTNKSSYTVIVRVTDFFGKTYDQTLTVTVNASHTNHAPNISNQAFSINDGSANNTVVGTVVASDPDAGDTLNYSITGGNTGNAFSINASTGLLSVSNSAALTSSTFSLTVKVTDTGGLTATATVTVHVNPPGSSANNPPVIANQTFVVDDGSANGTVVGSVVASDPDVGDTLTYSIIGGNTGNAFSINAGTGVLSVSNSAAVKYATNPSFSLNVRVTDNGGLYATATVTVNVNAPAAPPPSGHGGGGGCSVIPVGGNPDASLALAVLVMLGYGMRRRWKI
jgi:hypothetical protein